MPKPNASGGAAQPHLSRDWQRIAVPESDLPSARATVEHGFIRGSPARVAEAIAEIDKLGIGGVIASFRLGPMSHETAANSLRRPSGPASTLLRVIEADPVARALGLRKPS
jgi:hypothetical protein